MFGSVSTKRMKKCTTNNIIKKAKFKDKSKFKLTVAIVLLF